MQRIPLDDRRRAVTQNLEHGGHAFTLTIGVDNAGAPREVFAKGPKTGTSLAHVLDDACVLISLALQHGIEPRALEKSLGTVPDYSGVHGPASPIGAILAAVTAFDTGGVA